MIQIISLLITFFAFSGGLITVWVKINVKIKELDIKITNMEGNYKEIKDEMKEDRLATQKLIEKSIDKIWLKLDSIDNKIDEYNGKLIKLQSEHDLNKCYYKEK